MIRRQKIVVTGGAGFIGSHLAEKLAETNDVCVVDDLSFGKIENIANPDIEFVKADVRDHKALKNILEDATYVFHLAALATTRERAMGWDNPRIDWEINAMGTFTVLQACLDNNVKKVVYTSSAAVYGRPKYLPVDENHPLNPISPYGISKLCGEKSCIAFYEEFGLNSCIARIFNGFGPKQPRYVIHDLIHKLKANFEVLELIGDGKQTRDFVYVSDIIDALILIASNGKPVETYNIGTETYTSITKLAEIITKLLNIDPEFKYTGTSWKGDISNFYAKADKIQKLGWSHKVSLEEGIRKYMTYLKSHE